MKMAAQGVEILGVLYEDREPQEARNILAKQGNPFTKVGIDLDGDLGIAFGISGVPESFLIDANGEIVKTKRNYFTEDDLPEFIAAYKAEVAKAAKAS
jgi:cytochrome c biogenesis protein CcmG/thiol:disulfide interchange protein DsbE